MNNIVSDWDHMAQAYETFNNSEDSYSYNIEWPCIRNMLLELRGKTVLDLGCGTGIFSFLLEQYAPARVVGIDASREMLKIAGRKAKQLQSKVSFLLGDAANAFPYVQEPFDLVFSSTTTHYIPDLEALMRSIGQCLKSGGTCILSVIHPVYSAMYPIQHGDQFPDDEEWVVRYLDKRKRAYIQPWIEYNDQYENRLSTSYHYTFADYVNAIVKSGLSIQEVQEPLPPETWKTTSLERYESFVETPTYLILKLGKR